MKIGNSVIDNTGCFIFDMKTCINKMRDVSWDQLNLKINVQLHGLARDIMDHNRYVHRELKLKLPLNKDPIK